jgi:hypothetical protein
MPFSLVMKLQLYIIMHYVKKAYGEMEVGLHEFSILTLDKGEWLASQPGHLTLGEGRPLLVSRKDGGPHAGLDELAKIKFATPAGDPNRILCSFRQSDYTAALTNV